MAIFHCPQCIQFATSHLKSYAKSKEWERAFRRSMRMARALQDENAKLRAELDDTLAAASIEAREADRARAEVTALRARPVIRVNPFARDSEPWDPEASRDPWAESAPVLSE